jgi:hypothetical protein
MKIRTGFVSNSSSSSFIAIGIRATEEISKKVLEINNLSDDDYYDCDDIIYDDSEYGILGVHLAIIDDCGYIEDKEISLSDRLQIIENLSSKYCIPKEEFKLITGTQPC